MTSIGNIHCKSLQKRDPGHSFNNRLRPGLSIFSLGSTIQNFGRLFGPSIIVMRINAVFSNSRRGKVFQPTVKGRESICWLNSPHWGGGGNRQKEIKQSTPPVKGQLSTQRNRHVFKTPSCMRTVKIHLKEKNWKLIFNLFFFQPICFKQHETSRRRWALSPIDSPLLTWLRPREDEVTRVKFLDAHA